jgi:predicted HicB family RNase H-like nuclease
MSNRSIRGLDPALFHQARIEALKAKVPVGQWVNQAISERLVNDSKKIKC